MEAEYNLDKAIRKVEGFPKEGILFYDITSILTNPEAFSYCIDRIVERYRDSAITSIAAIEARGFIFAAPAAERLGLPLVLVRKKGKLPGATFEKKFMLEYGEDIIQIQKSDIHKNDRILVIDDLIATGGTLKAAAELIEEAGASIEEIFCIIGLPFLNDFKPLKGYKIKTLIDYQSESI